MCVCMCMHITPQRCGSRAFTAARQCPSSAAVVALLSLEPATADGATVAKATVTSDSSHLTVSIITGRRHTRTCACGLRPKTWQRGANAGCVRSSDHQAEQPDRLKHWPVNASMVWKLQQQFAAVTRGRASLFGPRQMQTDVRRRRRRGLGCRPFVLSSVTS